MSYIFITENLTIDSFTFEVIDAESLIVIFFGTYGSIGGFEWISINLSKSAAFSLSENT